MTAFTRLLYSSWLLSLPFYTYSVWGSLSVDNILVPVVCVFAFFRSLFYRASDRGRAGTSATIIVVALFGVYAAALLYSVAHDNQYFMFALATVGKKFLYLLAPMLFICNRDDFFLTSRLLVVVAVVGAFSALLASYGIIELRVVRFAESRIGVESLRKAIGLFANFGDMAILGSYCILYLLASGKGENPAATRLLKMAIGLLIIAGYIGAQSRNMLITLVVGLMAFAYLRVTAVRGLAFRTMSAAVIVAGGVTLTAVVVFGDASLLSFVRGWGGTREAAATVAARLVQYEYAWNVFLRSPLYGLGAEVMRSGAVIHNTWLGLMAQAGLLGTAAVAGIFLLIGIRNLAVHKGTAKTPMGAFGLAALLSVFVAAEFYGGMTYVFLVVIGILAMVPVAAQRDIANSATG